ncbi:MAG: hypothetical protein ACTHXG_14440 [Micrococcaceae bacterium]
MAKARVELDTKGVRELMKDKQTGKSMSKVASKIASAAGSGHSVNVESSSKDGRQRAVVATRTHAARRAEARNRNLTNAINAGRV